MRTTIACMALLAGIGLAGAGCAQPHHAAPEDVVRMPAASPTIVEHYGPGPLQIGELRLPPGKGPFPVAVILHGGCFVREMATLAIMAPMADALAKAGVATWNVDYRELGDAGGGWPGSWQDWGAAVDHLRALARRYPLDLGRVVAIGHSAGAYSALWLAERGRLPAASPLRGTAPLPLKAVVAIDGPGDIRGYIGKDSAICGRPVIAPMLGGTPAEVPAHYAETTPFEHQPLGVPQYLISASPVLTPPEARAYVAAARAKGDRSETLEVRDSSHFDVIAPGTAPFAQVRDFILTRGFGMAAR